MTVALLSGAAALVVGAHCAKALAAVSSKAGKARARAKAKASPILRSSEMVIRHVPLFPAATEKIVNRV
jgi:hypothetical protein